MSSGIHTRSPAYLQSESIFFKCPTITGYQSDWFNINDTIKEQKKCLNDLMM